MKKLKCFLFVAAVAFALVGCRKPAEVSFAENAKEIEGTGETFEVGLESNGEWTVTTTVEWVAVTPNSGSGNTTLTVTVQPNSTSGSRTAEVKATTKDNTAVLTLTQGIMENYITVAPASIRSDEAGGEYNVEITSNIAWRASEVPSWISLSEIQGTGNSTIVLTVLPIAGEFSTSRTTEVVFGNDEVRASLTVEQGLTPPVLISVSPESLEMASEGETKTLNVLCEGEWNVVASQEWVTLDKSQGSGDMTVEVTVDENPVYEQRRATVTFRSSTGSLAVVTVTQEASADPHFLDVSPSSIHFGSEGGERGINISCDTEWKADAGEGWLSLSEVLGTGNATITLTAEPNVLLESRTALIVIASDDLEKEITVTQEAGSEQLYVTFSPDTLYASYTGESRTVSLSSNTSWVLESSSIIAFLTPAAGNGDATITTIIDVNSSAEPRTGYLRAKHHGQVMAELVIIQEGKPDLLETDITGIMAPGEGGEYTIHVTSNQGWAVVVSDLWMRATPTSGFGNGDIKVVVDPMNSTRPRTGTITIKAESGKIVVVEVKQQP